MLSETFFKASDFVFSRLKQLHFNKFPLILFHLLFFAVSCNLQPSGVQIKYEGSCNDTDYSFFFSFQFLHAVKSVVDQLFSLWAARLTDSDKTHWLFIYCFSCQACKATTALATLPSENLAKCTAFAPNGQWASYSSASGSVAVTQASHCAWSYHMPEQKQWPLHLWVLRRWIQPWICRCDNSSL